MNVAEILNSEQFKNVPNPNYNSRSKKNQQPKYLQQISYKQPVSQEVDLARENAKTNYRINYDKIKKYEEAGLNWNPRENFDKILAQNQSAGEKLWNALKQTVVNEMALGTVKGFADIFDFVTSGLNPDDYSNPLSRWCKEQQEVYENANPIFADPDKHLFNGGLLDMGWIASNLPSVASTISLMIPGYGVTKGISALGKFLKIDKGIGFTRKWATGLKGIEKKLKAGLIDEAGAAREIENLSKVKKWINTTGAQQANELFGTAINAASMRIAENYQEAQDTYAQMYEQAANKFNTMDDEEFKEYLKNHPELQGVSNKDEAAKFVAKKSADKTFWNDAVNFFFDFIELRTLGDVGKLAKNVDKTSGARKALRLEKERIAQETKGLATTATEETAKEVKDGLVKNTLKSIGNFISDHRGNGKVLFAELSEGIEEAVNYVAQQEGLHYGNVMLDNEKNTAFGTRLRSYMNSSDLYDAAFWGWMGGVLFQGVGGKVKAFAENSYNKAMSHFDNTNDSSKGEKSTSWSNMWEVATTKRQVEEINGRMNLATEFRNKLDMIANDQNPYEKQEDGQTPATITSQTEATALKEKAKDEYLAQLTMRAIDAGNYDDVKEFLRDDIVNKRLQELGIVDEADSKGSTEKLINDMEKVADRYQDNLLAINLISEALNYGVPMEYQQIIARDNTAAQLKIDDLNRRITNYETAAENHRRIFSKNLQAAGLDPDNDSDYKNAVFLVEAANRLGELKAQKRAILSGDDSKSLDNQDLLRFIDRQIDSLNQLISNTSDKIDTVSRLLWAHGTAARYTYNENTGFSIQDNENFIKFLDAFNNARSSKTKESIKALSDVIGVDFELTDNEILAIFGEDNQFGAYQNLNADIAKIFPNRNSDTRKQRVNTQNVAEKEVKGLREASSLLHDDYRTLAALNFAKIYEDSLINLTSSNISRRVQELDNQLNKARVAVKNKAFTALDNAQKKYGTDAVLDYINNPEEEIPNITLEDKKTLDDAISALDMQKEANSSIFNEIRYRFIQNVLNESEESQNSTGNQNQPSSSNNGQSINTQPQQQGQATQPANPQNGQPTPQQTPQNATQPSNGKLQLTITPDGKVKGNIVANTDDNQGLTFKEDANGNIILDADTAKDITTAIPTNVLTNLFDIVDERTDKSKEGVKTITNPVIKKEADGSYSVVNKGTYKLEDTPTQPNLAGGSSTGEPDSNNTTKEETIPSPTTGNGLVDKQALANENKTADYISKIRTKLESYKKDPNLASMTPQEAVQAAINDIESDPSYNKTEDNAALVVAKDFYANRLLANGLIKDIAEVVVHSSITENVKHDKEDDYTKSVDKLFNTYYKKYNLPIINGKMYINLEDVLRHLNEEYGNPIVAGLVYKQMVEYVTSELAKNKYVVTDENPKSSNFLDNIRKSIEERINETVQDEGIHRVNIDRYLNNDYNSPENQVYRSLQANEPLDIEIDDENGRVLLLKNNVVIGDIPLADVTTNGYRKINLGFITEVHKQGEHAESPLKDMLSAMATKDEFANLRNNIWTYTFDKTISKQDKAKLVKAIYNEVYQHYKHLIAGNAKPEDIATFLSRVVKYRNSNTLDSFEQRMLNKYLEGLFDAYYDSYELAGKLYTYPDKMRITINKVTEGEPNYCPINKNDTNYSNYAVMSYAEEALDSSHINRTEIGYVNQEATAIELNGRSVERTGLRKGTPYLVIPNGSEESHIFCFATKLSDTNAAPNAQALINAINKEWNRRFKEIEDAINNLGDVETAWNNFITYLFQLTGKHDSRFFNAQGHFENVTNSNRPILRADGLHWSSRVGKGFANLSLELYGKINIQFIEGKPGIINIRDNSKPVIDPNTGKSTINFVTYNLGVDDVNQTSSTQSLTSKDKIKLFKDYLESIRQQLTFNIDNSSVNQTPTGQDNDLITIEPNGKITISIPTENNPAGFQIQADSFSQLVIQNSLVKANIQVDPKTKSNFKPKGEETQQSNRVLKINVDSITSSPVEDIVIENLETETRDILSDDSITDKASELIKDDFSEDTLKSMQELHLLPENVIFAEDFNQTVTDKNGITKYLGNNAEANLKSGITTVGNRWIAMFNETGEFANGNGQYRAQAIRKLIHEQIHLVLNDNSKKDILKRIKEIYEEFKKSLDDVKSVELKQQLSVYLFDDKKTEAEALEEFLVESFTSGELAEYLNSVKTTVTDAQVQDTLLQKIMKFLSEIFKEYYKARGWDASVWNIEKGSLREKTFMALQKELKQVAKGATKKSTKKTTKSTKSKTTKKRSTKKTKPVDDGQLLLDFDAAENTDNQTLVEPEENKEPQPEPKPIEETPAADIDADNFKDDDNSPICMDSSVTEKIQTVYPKELQEIKDKAIADGTFMKAPNGKPTNLNERQWLQVRTKAFKDWFGDWEVIANDNADLASIPNLRQISVDSFLKAVNDTLETQFLTTSYLTRESVNIINKLFDLSKIKLYQGDIKTKGLSYYTGAIVLNTMPMEEAAKVFVHEVLHSYTTYAYDTDATFRKEIDKYHKIALEYKPGFSKNVYEFMANSLEPNHMATLLDIPSENTGSNLLKDIINSFVKHIRQFFKNYETKGKRTLFHDVIETIYNHKRSNAEFTNSVSKVVDENGEPLVVYRGEQEKNEIKKDGYNFFSSDKEYAEDYGITEAYFLNIKTPLDIRLEYNSDGTAVLSNGIKTKSPHSFEINYNNIKTWEQLNTLNNKDGIIGNDSPKITMQNEELNEIHSNGIEYVTFNPNQIKSATDNQGTFSTIDDNIRHSSVTERIQQPIASVRDLANTLHLENQGKFLRDTAKGEQQITCH